MSGWKLVEAVVEAPQSERDNSRSERRAPRDGNAQRRNSREGGRGRGPKPQDNGGASDGVVDAQTLDYYAHLAAQQIEYLFSEENLCMDTFIRSYMDVQGNVPLGVVCSYQNVAYFNIPPSDVFAKLIALHTVTGGAGISVGLEIDEANELIRRKDKWEMWLMPNAASGSRGLPLYSSLVDAPHKILNRAAPAPAATVTAATTSTQRRSRSGTEELSANAIEFKPSTVEAAPAPAAST